MTTKITTNAEQNHGQWMSPVQFYVLKYLNELLAERYVLHDDMLQRLTHNMPKGEAEKFVKMAVDIFEIGYKKAVNDYKKAVEPYGIRINIVPEDQSSK